MRLSFYIWLLSLQLLSAASWYVDNANTGTRNGTSWATAWTNLNSVTGTSAGDTIYISGGSTTKTYGDPYWTPPNGTAGNPITIRIGQDSGHNGVATFDGRQINSAWIYGALKNVVIDGSYNGSTNFVSTNCLATGYSVWCDGAASLSVNYVRTYNSWKFAPGTNIVIDLCYIKPPPPNTPGTLLPTALGSLRVMVVLSVISVCSLIGLIVPVEFSRPDYPSSTASSTASYPRLSSGHSLAAPSRPADCRCGSGNC